MPEGKTTPTGVPIRGAEQSVSPELATQSQQPQIYGHTSTGIPIANPYVGAAGSATTTDPTSWAEYARLSDHPFMGDPNQQNLAHLQSGKEQFLNSLVGAGVNIGAGFVESVGSWDLGDAYDMASGVNKEYGNWAHDIAKSMGNWQQQNFPVYEKDPGAFAPGDPGWWGNMAKNMGFTLGFAAEAGLEQIALGLMTGGVGNELSAVAKIRTLTQLRNAARMSKLGEAAFGAFKGLQEATTNGYETFDNAYQTYIDKGFSKEDATRFASQAAAVGWRTEVGPLMILNAAQYATLAHNPAGVSEGLTERLIGGIESPILRTGAKLTEQVISEGAEEGWQTISSQEGKYSADVMAGLQTPKDFSDRLSNYAQSAELWNSVFAGALGGVGFAGVGELKERVRGMNRQEQQQQYWEDYKTNMQGMTLDYLSKVRTAEKAGDVALATSLKQEMSLQTALQSYHIDHLKGDASRATYQSHVTSLQGILNAVETGNQEAMDAYKIGEDDKEFVKRNFPEMISKAKDAARIYDSIKGSNDASVLVPMAYRQQLTEDFSNRIGQARQEFDAHMDQIPGTRDLSTEGKAMMKLDYQLDALDEEEARIKQRLKVGGFQMEQDGLKERLEKISALREKGKKEYKELSERQKENPEVAARDKQIDDSIPQQSPLEWAAYRRAFNETELHQTRKELAYISSKEYQTASASVRMEKLMDQATTPQQAEAVVTASTKANNGVEDPKVREAAEKKKKTLAAQAAVQQTNASLNQNKPKAPVGNAPTAPSTLQSIPPVSADKGAAPNFDPDNSLNPPASLFTPGMISPRMREELEKLKFSDSEISAMTPEQAQQNLSWKFDDKGNEKISPARAGELGEAMDLSTIKTGGGKTVIDLNSGNVYDDNSPVMFPDYDDASEKGKTAWEQKVARAVSNYVENMAADENAKPVGEISFRDMLRDLIHHRGKEITQKNFDLYKLGWGLNKYKETDFDADYKALFGDRADLADELNSLSYGLVGKTPAQIQKENKDAEFQTNTGRDPLEYVYDESGERKPQHKGYRTDSPELALDFLNQGYTEHELLDEETGQPYTIRVNEEGLLVNPHYDPRELMLPSEYQPGTKMIARVPENAADIEITVWNQDYSDSRKMKFGNWASLNGIQPGSPMWIAMVPVLVYNEAGKPVAMVRNTEWYNPQNMAGENDPTPARQTKLILEGRANVMGLRKTLMGGPVELTVTKKTIGNKTEIKEGPKPLSQVDPTTVLAFRTAGDIIFNSSGQEILPEQIIKKETDNRPLTLKVGDAYDLRQTGMVTLEVFDKQTNRFVTKTVPQYMALGVNKPAALDAHAQSSIAMAIQVFLSRSDDTGAIMNPELRNKIQQEVLAISRGNHNLFNEIGLRDYLKQFIRTPYGDYARNDPKTGKYSSELTMQAIYNDVEGAAHILPGTPFITVYANTVVAGIKGMNISNSDKYSVRYVSPGSLEVALEKGDQRGQQTYVGIAKGFLTAITAPHNPANQQDVTILSRMKNNVSGKIQGNNNVALIDAKGVVTDGGNYTNYLKDRLTTTIQAYNVGTADKPAYATYVQPRIEYTYSSHAAASEAEKKEAFAAQQPSTQAVTTEIVSSGATPPAVSKDARVAELRARKAANREALEDRGIDTNPEEISMLPNYEADTDDLIDSVVEVLTKVKGMSLTAVEDSVSFITRGIEEQIDTKYGSKVSKKTVMESVKGLLEDTLGESNKVLESEKAILEELVELGEATDQEKLELEQINSVLAQTALTTQNWKTLAAAAMERVLTETGIIESTKDFSQFASEMLTALRELNYKIPREQYDLLRAASEGEEESYEGAAKVYNELMAHGIDGLDLEDLEVHSEQEADDGSERENNFSKTSLQENNKGSVPYLFRRFTSAIPEYNSAGKKATGFAGLTKYPGYGYYFDKIMGLLIDGSDCPPDYKSMVDKLKSNAERLPWLQDFLTRLEGDGKKVKGASEQVKRAFSYGLNLHGSNFKFMMFWENEDEYGTQVYDTNSSEIKRKIQKDWYENFKMSPLTDDSGENLNLAEVDRLIGIYDDWYAKYQGKAGPPIAEAAAWLRAFGITLAPETLAEIADNRSSTGGIRTPAGNKLYWADMFGAPSLNSYSLFMVLRKKLRDIRTESVTNPGILNVRERGSDGDPFRPATGILSKFANIEKKYTSSTTTASVRDGDKSLYGYTSPSMSSHVEMNLKNSFEYRESLNEVEALRGSFVLQMLRTSDDFKHKFDFLDMGINSIKQIGRKMNRATEYNDLSEADQEYTAVGLFQDEQVGDVNSKAPMTLEIYGKPHTMAYRMGVLLFPASSDKTQVKMMQTSVIRLRKGTEMFVDQNRNVMLSNEALAFAFSQLVEPELRRMCAHHSAARKGDADTLVNIDGYNKGAQMFIGVPEMNNLVINGVKLTTYIAEAGETMTEDFVNDTIAKIRDDAHKYLQDFFRAKVDFKIGSKEKPGSWEPFIEWENDGTVRQIHYLNGKYMKNIGEADRLLRLKFAAMEYVYNTHIHTANNFQLHGLDLAHFSQDKAFKKDFHESEPGNKRYMSWLPKTADAYYKAVKNFIDVNLGKRMAMLIAPRKSLHNSRNDKFIRLALEDRTAVAQNIDFQIELRYGKEALAEPKVQEWLDQLKNLSDTVPAEAVQIADAREELMKKFPEIGGFFEITSTDGEEYVTGKEAVDILYGQGRLSEKAHKDLLGKLGRGETLEYDDLEAVKQIMQPMQATKPVQTGVEAVDTPAGKLMRPDYVKSSAIPLLPQTTKGKEIDHLRMAMESLQRRTGKNVRASYHSATKVGDVLAVNRLKVWDNKGNFIKGSIKVQDLEMQAKDKSKALSLTVQDRENWGIQQDVPDKVDKPSANTVAQISQAMKAVFGDDVLKDTREIFTLNGKPVTAKQLYDHFVKHYGELQKNEKTRLYDDLLIDESTGKPIAGREKESAEKVQQILQTEAKSKGYSKTTLEGLTLEDDGAFTLPVWMAPEADKLETMLNSIVSNRLVHLKFPGSQYVNASEEGFRTAAYEDEIAAGNIDHGRMIYTPAWEGELKAARFDEDGNFLSSQVIISQQFQRPDGTFIDLIKDGFAHQNEKGMWMLDMDKVDSSLLDLSSFRIPLSGHVSMSQLQIVAFLPSDQTGLAILPRNLITQKGFDFDVDKEFTYALNHKLAGGKLVPLTEENTKLTARNKSKLHQNEIVKVFHSFLSSGDPAIQKRINKVFDIKFEQSQRDLFNNATSTHDTYFSLFDDEHQKRKRALGAAGKSAIGVYANMSSFHNLIQQNPKVMQVRETIMVDTPEGPKPRKIPFEFWLCGYKSDGVLGRAETKDKTRPMTDAINGRLQISTDNEKEQVLGAVGINSITISADVLVTQLGFDMADLTIPGQEKQTSASWLLLSQPIIKDYVKALKATRGLTSDYTPDAKEKVKQEMVGKYAIDNAPGLLEDKNHYEILDLQKKHLTADAMLQEINNGGQNRLLQQVALHLFLRLNEMAPKVSKIYNRFNIQTSGLGKSIPETLALYNEIEDMGASTVVTNIDGLVGDFLWVKQFTEAQIPELEAQGYMRFEGIESGTFLVKPTTVAGHQVLSAAKSGYELWSHYYPYNNPTVQELTDRMMAYMSDKEDDTTAMKAEKRKKIMDYIKMALFSSPTLGMFTGDPQAERYRLFMDNHDPLHPNMSLATYLKSLQSHRSPSTNFVNNNSLISAFDYELNKNTSARTAEARAPEPGIANQDVSLFKEMKPSYFIYNNAQGADVGEDHKYMALIELMDKQNNQVIRDIAGNPIPFNGIPEYTTRMLAHDIITASYLKSGIQRATEVTKYVPVPYLKGINFAAQARRWQAASVMAMNGDAPPGGKIPMWEMLLGRTTPDKNGVSEPWRLERQIVQHDPRSVPAIPEKFKAEADKNSFTLPQDLFNAYGGKAFPYLHFAKGKADVRLFEQVPGTMEYVRINTLGIDGRGLGSEFSISQPKVLSIANVNVFTPRIVQKEELNPPAGSGTDTHKENMFKLSEGNLTNTIVQIRDAQIPIFSETAGLLLPFINNDTRLVIGDIPSKGQYVDSRRTITIGRTFLNKPEYTQADVAQAVLHEYVHSIADNELMRYFNNDGSFKPGVNMGNLPAHITKLHRTFQLVVSRLGKDKIDEFAEYYQQNKGKFRTPAQKEPGSTPDILLYGGYTIKEMLTMTMTYDKMRDLMSEVEAVPGLGVTLGRRFAEALVKFMEAIGVRPGTLTAQIMEAVLETAEMQKKRRLEESRTAAQQQQDAINQLQGPDKLKADNFDLTTQLADAQRQAEIAEAQQQREGPPSDPAAGKTSGFSEVSLFPYVDSEMRTAMAEIDRC
jgi:hypothetical protein